MGNDFKERRVFSRWQNVDYHSLADVTSASKSVIDRRFRKLEE